MFTKMLVAATVTALGLSLSGAARAEVVYQGGPKGMMTIRPATSADPAREAFAQQAPRIHSFDSAKAYVGGPKSAIHMTRR